MRLLSPYIDDEIPDHLLPKPAEVTPQSFRRPTIEAPKEALNNNSPREQAQNNKSGLAKDSGKQA